MNDQTTNGHDPRHELEDRLTDQALGELLGGHNPPDLTARIVAAASAPARRPHRSRRALVAVACIVFAVGLAVSGYAGYLLGRGRSADQTPAVAKAHEPGGVAKRSAPPTTSTPPAPSLDRPADGGEAPSETAHDRLAALVERFNAALNEKRYSDAQAISQQGMEIFPDELVVTQMKNMMRMLARSQKKAASIEPDSNGLAAYAAREADDLPADKAPSQFGSPKA
jgi:hypothetical protein